MNNSNIIDNPKGRKWSWGHIKFIGEFTTVDFFIIFFSILIVIFSFATSIIFLGATEGILIGFTIFFIMFLFDVVLIKEYIGYKSYELIHSSLTFSFKAKKHSLASLMDEDHFEKQEVENE